MGAQDFGVYWMTPGSLSPVKVSPPDLDRLIEAQVKAGNLWKPAAIRSAARSSGTSPRRHGRWEFNLSTKKWNERWS
jgi:hypothetical protein